MSRVVRNTGLAVEEKRQAAKAATRHGDIRMCGLAGIISPRDWYRDNNNI